MSRLILSLDGQVLKELKLEKERLTIGRRPHNDLQIDNLAVSGQHAQITTLGGDSFLEDLDSTNGTLVNGSTIKKHYLQDGDLIEIGKYKLKYTREGANPAAKEDLDKTMVLRRPPSAHEGNTIAQPQHAASAPPGPPPAALRVLTGGNAGKQLPLSKPTTTLGKAGVQVVAILRQPQGYYLNHVEGDKRPLVNGHLVGDDPYPLVDKDKIEIGGVQMEMVIKH